MVVLKNFGQAILTTTDFIFNRAINYEQRYFLSIRSESKYSPKKHTNTNCTTIRSPDLNLKEKEEKLVNEHLISHLLKQTNKSVNISGCKPITVESISVRLITNQESVDRTPTRKVEITSLLEAIKKSCELGVDLVGLNLSSIPPVIYAVDANKLIYQASKKKKSFSSDTKAKRSSATQHHNDKKNGHCNNALSLKLSKRNKSVKIFKYRAGIDNNDLQRKTKNLIKYLRKGYTCQVIITSNNHYLREDNNALSNTLKRVQLLMDENDGSIQGNIRKSSIWRGAIIIQPKKTNR